MIMTRLMVYWGILFHCLAISGVADDKKAYLVENGAPRAVIVTEEDPPRLVKIGAKELQACIQKISGAQLPVLSDADETSSDGKVRIYVGRSKATDELGIDGKHLRYGACRIVSGPDYLVLLGHDEDFVPVEPYAHGRQDISRAEQDWDALTTDKTSTAWGFPMTSLHRDFNRKTGTWRHDESGSLQAVYVFLRSLGVRWYWPGDLGEVLPKLDSIELPNVNETVIPDFPVRHFIGPAWQNAPVDAVLWAYRLGLNSGYARLGIAPKTHGFSRVHARRKMQETHPDYYALIGEKRDVSTRGTGHACWSSAGLQREAVAYARTMFDHYGVPTLQLSPQDGLRFCQCDRCTELTPSDAVWGFLNRVARETIRTHPDQLLVGAAYSSYRELPESIERLSPNIAVRLNNVGRPNFREADHWQWYRDLTGGWLQKAESGQLIRVENNYYDTVIHPRSIARDLRAMKGVSLGEMNEVHRDYISEGRGQTWGRPGTNHLNLYVNASFLRDADQDIESLLSEYYRKFYGPAAGAMRRAFDYAEENYTTEGRARLELPERVRLLELLHEARESSSDDSLYRRRIQFIIDEFAPLEELQQTLLTDRQRGDVPVFEYWNRDSGKWENARALSKIDGRLDEAYWNMRGKLKRNDGTITGRFQILLDDEALWIGIHLGDSKLAGDSPDEEISDAEILENDRVEISLETDAHAHYRIAVSPTGAIYDSDMNPETNIGERWNSNAEIAVHREGESLSIEVRIPIVSEKEGAGDPLHHTLFRRPPEKLWPWYFNILQIEKTGTQTTISSFVPVEKGHTDDRLKFGELSR